VCHTELDEIEGRTVFARDAGARAHADALGADWVGATEAAPPRALDAIIDTTPAWKPVVEALARLKPAGCEGPAIAG
jgi:propanol-preferring alcohol dehydrogenase